MSGSKKASKSLSESFESASRLGLYVILVLEYYSALFSGSCIGRRSERYREVTQSHESKKPNLDIERIFASPTYNNQDSLQ